MEAVIIQRDWGMDQQGREVAGWGEAGVGQCGVMSLALFNISVNGRREEVMSGSTE